MFMGAVRHRLFEFLLIAASLGVTWAIHSEQIKTTATQSLDLFIRDNAQRANASEKQETRLAVVDINEESIQALGPWPWSRQQLAELAAKLLKDHDVALVVLDMVFPEARDALGDAALLAMAESRRLVLSEVLDYEDRVEPILTGELSQGLGPIQEIYPDETRLPRLPHATGFMGNHALLAQAPCVGNIGFRPDADGQLRRLPLASQWDGRLYAGLSLVSLYCLGLVSADDLQYLESNWTLRYRRADSSWLSIPAVDVLRGQPIPSLKGRIVLVGSSALGLADRVATPLSNSVAGVYIHAQALSELLDLKNLGQPVSKSSSLAIQLALVACLAAVIVWGRSLRWLVLGVAVLGASWGAFSVWQSLLASPSILSASIWGMSLLVLGLMPLEWFHDRRAARTSLALLSRYVAPSVLKELMQKASEDNPLAPRSREVTALVADMADYSVITRSLPLQDAAFVTRNFLEALTVPVWTYRGTLDRYSGDGLVAFWGAPLDQPDQTDLAVDAAKAMKKAVEELNERLAARLLPKVEVRIGIARSQALVGDFGTRYRAAYTAVGNCINFAARLEALAKELGESILISHEASQAVQRHSLTPLPPVQVKGFGEVMVYRP
jgi:adenylate cyclase